MLPRVVESDKHARRPRRLAAGQGPLRRRNLRVLVGGRLMSKDTAYEVRFGALIAASARAMQAAWAAVLLVWVTRSLLEATTPILRARVNAETGYH